MARHTLVVGKVDYGRRGRKINEVDIEWELTPDGRFSASGNIWNSQHTDILSGGQNLDEIAKMFPHDDRVQRIVSVWRDWHLNDMKAGTPKQERAVQAWLASGNKYDYAKVVDHLKHIGLYEDDGYKYGSKWLREELPADVKNEIRSWSQFPQGALHELDMDDSSQYSTRHGRSKMKHKRTGKEYHTSLGGMRG